MPPHCDNQMLLHVVAFHCFFFFSSLLSPIFHQSSMHHLQETLIPDMPVEIFIETVLGEMREARKLANQVLSGEIGLKRDLCKQTHEAELFSVCIHTSHNSCWRKEKKDYRCKSSREGARAPESLLLAMSQLT